MTEPSKQSTRASEGAPSARRRAVGTMTCSREVLIDHPVEQIDLPTWIENLSDRDYQACSPAHRAAGIFRQDGMLGSINVESIGGHLLVHHYLAVRAEPGHLLMRSANSRAYLLHLFPVTIEVDWMLEVERRDAAATVFRCTVDARIPLLLFMVARLGLLPFFFRRHVEGEAPLFARDIARKIARQAAGDGA